MLRFADLSSGQWLTTKTTVALLRHRGLQPRHQCDQSLFPASISAPLCGGADTLGLQVHPHLHRLVGYCPGPHSRPGLPSPGLHCAIDEGPVPRRGPCLVPLLGHEHRYRLCHIPHPATHPYHPAYQGKEAESSPSGGF